MKRAFAWAKAQILGIASRPANHKLVLALFAVFAAAFLFTPDAAHAADGDAFDTLMIYAAKFFVWMAQIIGQLIVMLIGVVAVPILTYNEFATSNVIGTGWALVRDVMNIGFVIVLMLIAFGTILFGAQGAGGRFNWRNNLPTLLIFAILINFSRLICGIMIDFGQVILLTFANAIKDIAGGNFIQLFGLGDIMRFSSDSIAEKNADGGGLEIFYLLASAVVALIMMSIVLLTIITLIALLAFRIVVLWILVVLSPVAFFFGGAKSVLGGSFKAYDEWWSNFTAAVAIGPVLVFVLWLALAVAGSGNISGTEGFAMPSAQEGKLAVGEIPNEALKMDNLVSFIIAIGILFAGFDISLKIASALPGGMKALVGPGVAARATKSIARLGYRGAVGVAGGLAAGGMAVGRFGTGKAWKYGKGVQVGGVRLGEVGLKTTQKLQGLGKSLTASKSGVVRAAGAALYRGAGSSATQQLKQREKTISDQKDGLEGTDLEVLKSYATGPAYSDEQRGRQAASQYKLLTEGFLNKDMDANEMQDIYKRFRDSGNKDAIMGNTGMREGFLGGQKERLDMLTGKDEQSKKDFAIVKGSIDPSKLRTTVAPAALANEQVRDYLKSASWTTARGDERNAFEDIEKSGTGAQKDSLKLSTATGSAREAEVAAQVGQRFETAMDKFESRMRDIATGKSKENPADAVHDRTIDINELLKKDPDYLRNIKPQDMNRSGGAMVDHLARFGTAEQMRSLRGNKPAADVYEGRLSHMTADMNSSERARANAGAYIATGKLPSEGRAATVNFVIQNSPEMSMQMISQADQLAATGDNSLKGEVMSSLRPASVEKMLNKLGKGGAELDEQIKSSMLQLNEMFKEMGKDDIKNLSVELNSVRKMLKAREKLYSKA
ncbi:MAG: hypothetical protein ABIG32_02495 [Candidatus Uhrbacteria bacterium]|nr:hypothetical protein [Patescibacteria group bacterium]MBU1906933.1 hypothetical protein [Patescibacteria group bacterium]